MRTIMIILGGLSLPGFCLVAVLVTGIYLTRLRT